MLIVIDDFLEEQKRHAVVSYFSGDPKARQMSWIETWDDESPISLIVAEASKYFDLSLMAGCEYWAHYGTRPDWHIDRDEKRARRIGEDVFPLCSIVYYAEIENLTGGKFVTLTESITPVTNRVLMFSSGIRHKVEEYSGTRLSVAVNPWKYKPEGY